VEVVVGKAGTGKTYALNAAREAWEASGVRVTGVALAARAALELETSAGIRTTTLARLLHRLDDHRHGSPLPPGSVLVVDEAGMIGTRQLARLLDHTHTQSVKVVLVGDPRQLPEIDAGGLFRALTTRLPAIELTDNRRQYHRWEQAALDELRHGNPDVALAAYQAHGRIRTADTAEAVRQRRVDDWWTTASTDLAGSIMIGLRHTDVDDLNHHARTRMLTAGQLTGPTLVTGGGVELQVGERIVCLRNNRTLGVVNGTRATIIRAHPAARTIEAVDDRRRPLTLPGSYLHAGHVAHGYAITGHKAQGLTVDHTYILGTEPLYREWGYVAMSRGRLTNQLYHGPAADHDEPLHHHVHHDDLPDLTSQLRRSRAEQPITPEVAQIASTWRATLHSSPRPPSNNSPTSTPNTTAPPKSGRRSCNGSRTSNASRPTPSAPPSDVTPAPNAPPSPTSSNANATGSPDSPTTLDQLDDRLAHLPTSQQITAARTRLRDLDTQLRHHSRIHAAHLAADPPPYLLAAVGPAPTDRQQQTRWHHAVEEIEHHRLRWGITDPARALGSGSRDEVHELEHRRLQRILKADGETPDRQIVQRSRGRAR
jgi:hypothetical protein